MVPKRIFWLMGGGVHGVWGISPQLQIRYMNNYWKGGLREKRNNQWQLSMKKSDGFRASNLMRQWSHVHFGVYTRQPETNWSLMSKHSVFVPVRFSCLIVFYIILSFSWPWICCNVLFVRYQFVVWSIYTQIL